MIALVGRPNVGKSTVFNRLIGYRQAITSFEAGTTRDRHFGVARWFGHSWTVVDTAGVLFADDEQEIEQAELQAAMEEQVAVAIQEATLVALVVDVKEGLHPTEKQLVNILRRHNKPMVLLANKSDNTNLRTFAEGFHELGIDHIFPVSAIHGTGVGDFVDFLIKEYPHPVAYELPKVPKIAIIGRPNVGKSTLINQILGQHRLVVSDVPGTTRDSITIPITLPSGQEIELVDTAGTRRRGKIEAGVEKFSLFRALRAIDRSDIVIQLLTIEEAPTRGDVHVSMYARESGKPVILVLNKIDRAIQDIAQMKPQKQKSLGQQYLRRFPFMQRLPFFFVSALKGNGVSDFLNGLDQAIADLRNPDQPSE